MLDNDPNNTSDFDTDGPAEGQAGGPEPAGSSPAQEPAPSPGAPDTEPDPEPEAQPEAALQLPLQVGDPAEQDESPAPKPAKKTAAKKAAKAPAKKAAAKKAATKRTAKTTQGDAATEVAVDAPASAPVAEPTSGPTPDPDPDSASGSAPAGPAEASAEKPKKKAAPRKRTTRKVIADQTIGEAAPSAPDADTPSSAETLSADTAPADNASADNASADNASADNASTESSVQPVPEASVDTPVDTPPEHALEGAAPAAPMVLFKAPEPVTAPARKRAARKPVAAPFEEVAAEASPIEEPGTDAAEDPESSDDSASDGRGQSRGGRGRGRGGQGGNRGTAAKAAKDDSSDDEDDAADLDEQDDSEDDSTDTEGGARRRRRRGGRRRRKPSDEDAPDSGPESGPESGPGSRPDNGPGNASENGIDEPEDTEDAEDDSEADSESTGSRRRRRRRRTGEDGGGSDDGDSGGARARKQRNPEDEITSIGGSTRLEAKKQRRREGREAGRRRAPIVSEAEFLARREAVDRVMVIRQKDDLTQIGVLEDKVLVEHYVARESQTSLIGNVYLGRVQNVLPSMEAAFIDIGKGRNAVLYAGEVNWAAVGHKDGQQRKIESVLSSGQTILVQVSKDPVGHKGARLTGQISLPGRFLVYVPDGNTSGISRKLPDTERNRLKSLLKQIVPDSAGVIVRTAAEGASEEELTLDVERLTARWADIEEKVRTGKSPQLLYGEPDLTLKVVRDLFTEDFTKLVVQGEDAWDLVDNYVSHVAPDLQDRLERYEPDPDGSGSSRDLFASYRVDEQIAKGLDRKVWLPSGGSLVIDRTEAMTVVDVNTGKFTGSGGNLEETVTKNNLEAAEEMVRQLRLRDIGGIIVIDFIDMVLESNRDLVLRRLVECLGRDRTRHQVAEVTSLGLVQMTRKRIGTGLLEAFSTDCDHCKGRGLVVHDHPVESGAKAEDADARGRGRGRGGRNRGGRGDSASQGVQGGGNGNGGNGQVSMKPSPADLANTRPPEKSEIDEADRIDHVGGVPAQSDAREDNREVDPAPEIAVLTEEVSAPSEQGSPPESRPDSRPEAEPEPLSEQNLGGRRAASTPQVSSDTSQRPAQEPVEQPASAPEPSVAAVETPAATASQAPLVVTTTRRRTVRRPAGPPISLSEAAPNAGPGNQPAPSAEPPRADGTTDADSTWPTGGLSDLDEGGEDEPDSDCFEDSEDDAGNTSLLHVPVKRKGSRKR